MDNKRRVFITNAGNHNFNDANYFGDVIALTKGRVSNITNTDNLFSQISSILKESSPDDYLLLSGSGVIISIASVLFFHKHKRINMLIWNHYNQRYIDRTITLEQLKEIQDNNGTGI